MAEDTAEGMTLITGATSDIGAAIARRLSAAGALCLSGRNREALEAVRQSCADPDRHCVWEADLTDPAAAGESLENLLSTCPGGIPGFIHAAGGGEIKPLRLQTPEQMEAELAVNLTSALTLARVLCRKKVNAAALRQVLFISSVNASRGVKGRAPYAAAKAGLEAAVRCLALEWAPRTRVNAIAPGGVKTAPVLAAHPDDASMAEAEAAHPLGLGEPSDVADLAEFLMSDRARWLTGQTIVLDGGLSLKV